MSWLLENLWGYYILENIIQCSALSWRGSATTTANSENRTLLAQPTERELLVGRGKKIALQLSNTRQLLESSSPKLVFFLLGAKWILQPVRVLMAFFFPFTLFPFLPPETRSKRLERLQEPLHAITSQARRWQLRQGLMQSDIIECGLEQSSCLQPLLIVAVIR